MLLSDGRFSCTLNDQILRQLKPKMDRSNELQLSQVDDHKAYLVVDRYNWPVGIANIIDDSQ